MALCVGGAAAFLGTTSYKRLQERTLSLRGVIVEGHVIGATDLSKRRRNLQPIIYEFMMLSGEVIRSQDNVAQTYFDQLSLGSKVSIVYDPLDPSLSSVRYPGMEETFIPLLSFQFSGGIAAGLLALGGFSMFLSQRQYSREKRLLQQGDAVQATITDVRRYSFNGLRSAKITYTLRDERPDRQRKSLTGTLLSAEGLEQAILTISSSPTALIDSTDKNQCILYLGGYSKAIVLPST